MMLFYWSQQGPVRRVGHQEEEGLNLVACHNGSKRLSRLPLTMMILIPCTLEPYKIANMIHVKRCP